MKLVSRTTLLQMDKDLRACEDFARGEPVPGVDGSTLLLAFKVSPDSFALGFFTFLRKIMASRETATSRVFGM